MNKNFRLIFFISILLISINFVFGGNVINYKYDLSLGSSPQSPGSGWEEVHSVCIRTSGDGFSCADNVYLWRKVDTNAYQYIVNNGENPGGGWQIIRTLKSNYDQYMVTFYLWEKQGGLSMDIKLSHAGTGEAKEIDCRDFSKSLTDQGYVFGSRAAVQRFGGPVTSDVCLYQKEFKECSDGKDNDNDGKKDLNDKGCIDTNDDNEAGEPIGYLDAVQNCQKVIGWTCDSDDFNKALNVDLYVDGVKGTGTSLGTIKADIQREAGVGAACGGNSNHGYSLDLPASLRDGQSHKIYAYATNIGTPAKDIELTNTPLTFTCTPKCNADQTIFKTLTEKSSNAALYNDASFFNQICYNNIFGTATFSNPHACISNDKNVVLWLKTNSDSKVSTTKSLSEFTIPICYGDLKCRVIDTSQAQSCTPSEEIVASLVSTSNSLVSEKDDPNYPIKICCKSQISLNSAYWTNMKYEQISQTDINDEVKLIAFGNKLENEEIKFTIKKEVNFAGIDFLAKDKIVAKEITKGSFTWRAGADLQGNLKDAQGNWNSGDYYFEAILNGDLNSMKKSGNLKVSAPENNAPPFANIVSPDNGNIFFLGEQIQFTQNSYDIDDDIEYTWDFGDGISLTGNSQTLQNYNPIHIYTGVQNLGQKLIQLTVKDDRGLTSSDTVSILILNNLQETKTYSYTFINSPVNGKIYDRQIDYDASGTYQIRVEPKTQNDQCNKIITCIGGLCPISTNDNPSCYPETDPFISIINSPTSQNPADYDSITFCWNHKNYEDNNYGTELCTQGDSGKFFSRFYSLIGDKMSKLTIKTDIPSSAEVIFNIAFDKYICLNNISPNNPQGLIQGNSYWISSGNTPIESINDCERIDTLISGATCCPLGYSCSNDKCIPENIDSCSGFETQEKCIANNGNEEIAKKQITCNGLEAGLVYGTNNYCLAFCTAECIWDRECKIHSESGVVYNKGDGTPSKVFEYSELSEANSYCSPTSQNIVYDCIVDITSTGSCNSGEDFYTESWTVEYLEVKDGMRNVVTSPINDYNVLDQLPEECRQPTGSRTISCDKVIRLPFFDYRNLILSVLFLMIIYYLIINKNN